MHSDMYARPLRVPWVPTRGLLDVSKGTDVLDPVSSEERSLDFGERRNIRARGSLFSGFGELGFPLFQFWGK